MKIKNNRHTCEDLHHRPCAGCDASQVAALLAKTAKAAESGQFELYETTHQFDGTYANPQWFG